VVSVLGHAARALRAAVGAVAVAEAQGGHGGRHGHRARGLGVLAEKSQSEELRRVQIDDRATSDIHQLHDAKGWMGPV